MSGLDFFSLLGGGLNRPRFPWELDPSGGGMPYMTAADAGGGGDDSPAAPAAPLQHRNYRSNPPTPERVSLGDHYAQALDQGFQGTLEDFARMRQADIAQPPAGPPPAAAAPPPAGPVPRSLSRDLYQPLNLTSTMPPPGAAPVPPPGPPGAPPGAPPAAPSVPGARPPGPPGAAVPGVLQPKPASPLGGLFGLFGGGQMTGPDGKELTTEQMMDRYLRMQMQRAMMPDFGKMAAAFAEAGKPSLLPTGGMGAAIGKAAGAMSGGGDAKDAFAMMKIAQEIQDMRDKGAGRKAIGGKIDQFIELYTKMKGGGGGSAAPAAPSGGGQPPVKIEPLSGQAEPADSSYGDYGGGGDAISAPDTSPHPVDIIPKYESGGRNIEQQVVGPSGGYNPSVGRVTGPSSASGYWQMLDSTYRNAAAKTAPVQVGDQVIDPSSFSRAMHAPYEVQREVAKTLYDQRGYADWAPYNANLRRALARGEGPPSGGPQLASAERRVRIQPLSGEAAPAGGPAGNDDEDALALLLAQIGSQASTYGLGDTVKPLETWFYGRPEYKGRVKGAETGAEWGVREPIEQRARREQSELDKARDAARLKIELDNKLEEQRRAAQLDIDPSKMIWTVNPLTGQPEQRPITRYDLAQRYSTPGAQPTMPPGSGTPAGPLPGAPNMRAGGALPLAAPAPQGAPAGPAGTPAAPGPAAPPAALPQPVGELAKDHKWTWTPEGWKQELIPGSPTYKAQVEGEAQELKVANRGIQSIDRALDLSSEWSTGFWGARLAGFEGREAYNLASELHQLKAITSFAELQKMRQASPTGGALGAVSDTEGKKLESTITTLDQFQSKDRFDASMHRLKEEYLDTVYGSKEKIDRAVKEGKLSQRVADQVEALKAQALERGRPGGPQAGTPGGAPGAPVAMGGLRIGEVRKGHRYLGGDPNSQSSWQPVPGGQ